MKAAEEKIDSITVNKLDYILSGTNVSQEERNQIIDLIESLLTEEREKGKWVNVYLDNYGAKIMAPNKWETKEQALNHKAPNIYVRYVETIYKIIE